MLAGGVLTHADNGWDVKDAGEVVAAVLGSGVVAVNAAQSTLSFCRELDVVVGQLLCAGLPGWGWCECAWRVTQHGGCRWGARS